MDGLISWVPVGGLRKHSKYRYYVGSAPSSLQLFLLHSPFLPLYLVIGSTLKCKDGLIANSGHYNKHLISTISDLLKQKKINRTAV